MRIHYSLFLAATLACSTLFSFDAFTGKVTGNHVRMRLQPTLDSTVIDEFDKDEMVIVLGETDDFYAVQPPSYLKAYIYKTYVVDGVVEGNKVNIRLDPHLDSPVIAQLDGGQRINGIVSPLNNKWIELSIPEQVHFYISKHFIERAGGPEMASLKEKRKEEVSSLLASSENIGHAELEKPFPEIQLDGVYTNLNRIVQEYQDFPKEAAKAKEALLKFQDTYLQKKIAYLENQSQYGTNDLKLQNTELVTQMHQQKERLNQLQKQLETTQKREVNNLISGSNAHMSKWVPNEENLFLAWREENTEKTLDDFAMEQWENSVELSGVIEPYDRPIRNKPGDFLLVNKVNNLPVAYLYSTDVNLQNYLGREIKLRATLRPNNHFAYPAYFVLSAE